MITYKEVGLAEQKTPYGQLAGQCISVPQTVEETSPKTLSKYCEDNKRKNVKICRISSIDPGDTCTEHSIVCSLGALISFGLPDDECDKPKSSVRCAINGTLSVIGTGYR